LFELRVRPCVGCGFCCLQAMCSIGINVYGRAKYPCPYLIWSKKDNRYWCRLALNDVLYADMIHADQGCCSPLNTWRNDVRERKEDDFY
jgi:hypothetical protein